jgi:DNA end-binding protein Ku
MRAMWKGHLRFHLVTVPVKLYAAEESASKISFNQLHEEDYGRIGYVKRCKKCGKEVSQGDIVMGYQFEPDRYVVVGKEDIDKLKVTGTRVIDIEGFVDADEVDPMLFERPYFIGPDGQVAGRTYALLRDALRSKNKLGIGRVVLSDRESLIALAPHEQGLIGFKLRFPYEIRSIDNVPQIDQVGEAKKEEMKLAEQLIESMEVAFADIDMRDTYQEALLELVEAKAEGREIVSVEEEPREVVDIMSALEASIKQARDERKPVRKTSRRKAAGKKEKS